MVDPDNEERLLKIPLRVVAAIQADAEKRVREDAHRYCFQRDAHEAHAAGVDAAREAVVNVHPGWPTEIQMQGVSFLNRVMLLAAIDALRGE